MPYLLISLLSIVFPAEPLILYIVIDDAHGQRDHGNRNLHLGQIQKFHLIPQLRKSGLHQKRT